MEVVEGQEDGSIVTFQSWNGNYLCAKEDGSVQATNVLWHGVGERWKLEDHGNEGGPIVVALRSWTGNYLSANEDGSAKANVPWICEWEHWKLETHGDGWFALK